MDSFNRLRNLASFISAAIAQALRREHLLLFSGVLWYENGVQLEVDVNFEGDQSVLLFQRLHADLRGDLYSTHDEHFGPCDSISHDEEQTVCGCVLPLAQLMHSYPNRLNFPYQVYHA